MGEPKWTPGPWYAVQFWDRRNQIRARVGYREVVVANDVSPGDVPLILAAHDMREALQDILDNEMPDYKAAEEFGGYVLDDALRKCPHMLHKEVIFMIARHLPVAK